jgi:hypothetical protein
MMRNVKRPSGFTKVERTKEERRKSYSVNDEFIQEITKNMQPKTITDAIMMAFKKAKGEEKEI